MVSGPESGAMVSSAASVSCGLKARNTVSNANQNSSLFILAC